MGSKRDRENGPRHDENVVGEGIEGEPKIVQ